MLTQIYEVGPEARMVEAPKERQRRWHRRPAPGASRAAWISESTLIRKKLNSNVDRGHEPFDDGFV
jgi:hypothetical protein